MVSGMSNGNSLQHAKSIEVPMKINDVIEKGKGGSSQAIAKYWQESPSDEDESIGVKFIRSLEQ